MVNIVSPFTILILYGTRMVHDTFIEDYKYLDKQIIKYFETNINNLKMKVNS